METRSVEATHSTPNTCGLQNSVEFNNCRNLVRDQGVGGSNPLSPTNYFKQLERFELCASKVHGGATGNFVSTGMALGKRSLNLAISYANLFSRHLGHEPVSRTMDSTKVPGSGRFRF